MKSMENFFRWMSKPIPEDEVTVWFSVNNMIPEKIELFGDIFKGLFTIMSDTYLGHDSDETKIILNEEDKLAHFNWCWNRLLTDFAKENIRVKTDGKHREYFWEFFKDTFYNQKDENVRKTIPLFISDLFDMKKPYAKSDLEILTEIYKSFDKNMEY